MLVSAHNFGSADGLFRWVRRLRTIVVAAVAAIACLVTAASAAANNDALGYPHFSGSADPIPPEPARYRPDRMMQAMYDAEKSGTDFWMDRLLARRGDDPAGDWLLTRGRAVFMKTHDPRTIGFGGQVAYWESIDNRDAYAITVGSGGFTEDVGERLQTPSYFRGHYRNGEGLRLVVTKFITHENVAVTNVAITNTGSGAKDVSLRVTSPYTKTADGDELTGIVDAKNSLTTIFPRLSGDDVEVDGDALKGSVSVGAGKTVTTKVQMGFVTEELAKSRIEYDRNRDATPNEAFATHVRSYNKWWADNV